MVIGSLAAKFGPPHQAPKLSVPPRAVAPRMWQPATIPKRAPLVDLTPAGVAYQRDRERQEQEARLRQRMAPGF